MKKSIVKSHFLFLWRWFSCFFLHFYDFQAFHFEIVMILFCFTQAFIIFIYSKTWNILILLQVIIFKIIQSILFLDWWLTFNWCFFFTSFAPLITFFDCFVWKANWPSYGLKIDYKFLVLMDWKYYATIYIVKNDLNFKLPTDLSYS